MYTVTLLLLPILFVTVIAVAPTSAFAGLFGFTFTKTADPTHGNGPTLVTYTYAFSNTGEPGSGDMTSFGVSDDKCSPVSFVGGDDRPADGKVNPGETWKWTCSTIVSETTTNTATTGALLCVPGVPTCIVFDFIRANATVTIDQVVGGEILGIDPSALLVAGAFANVLWLAPTLAGIVALGVATILGVRRRKSAK